MKRKTARSITLILAMALGATQPSFAATVYQWTDAEGVVHFSDLPASDATATGHQQIELMDYANSGEEADEYSIVNQLETMAEWRRQTTEERLARKELQLEAKRIANERNANRYNVIERGLYQQTVDYHPYPVYINPRPHWQGYHWPRPHKGSGSGSMHVESSRFGVKPDF